MISKNGPKKERREDLSTSVNAGRIAKSILFWLVFFLILVGFTTLEFQLDQSLHGSIRKVLLILLLVVEFGAIMVWDNLKNRNQA